MKLLAPSHGREIAKVRVQGQLGDALWGTGLAGSSGRWARQRRAVFGAGKGLLKTPAATQMMAKVTLHPAPPEASCNALTAANLFRLFVGGTLFPLTARIAHLLSLR